jgi:uncharacterized protein YndB with AHSA1/START domain
MTDWTLNNIAIVFIASTPERIWKALTDSTDSVHAFLGDGATVGEVGGDFAIVYDGQPRVTGKVLVRDEPSLLRVTWVVPTPPGMKFPNCEVEYRIETAETSDGKSVVRLTVSEFVDGPVPPQFRDAGRIGWSLILSRIKSWIETGQPLPMVRLRPPS